MGRVVAMQAAEIAAVGQLDGGLVRLAVLFRPGCDCVKKCLRVEVLH